MDRIIIKKMGENINIVAPDIPDSENKPDVNESDWKNKMRLKKRKFRNEPDGYVENLIDGQGDRRNVWKGMGSENSYSLDGNSEPTGW